MSIKIKNYVLKFFATNLTSFTSEAKSPLKPNFSRQVSIKEIFQIQFECESLNKRDWYI